MTDMKKWKLGAYICVVKNGGFAFFNKHRYFYGERVIVESLDVLDKLKSGGEGRFMPESDFEEEQAAAIKKMREADKNNKTMEDIIKEGEEEKAAMKAAYENEIAALKEKLEGKKVPEKTTEKQSEK